MLTTETEIDHSPLNDKKAYECIFSLIQFCKRNIIHRFNRNISS